MFAGSGASAPEAFPRGAARAGFCEKDPGGSGVVEANIASLGYGRDVARLSRVDVLNEHAVPRMAGPFDLVFRPALRSVDAAEVFRCSLGSTRRRRSAGAIVSYEHDASDCARRSTRGWSCFAAPALAQEVRRHRHRFHGNPEE